MTAFKKHEYNIEVLFDKGELDMRSIFIIKAVPVTEQQALEIAKILYKNEKIKSVNIESKV